MSLPMDLDPLAQAALQARQQRTHVVLEAATARGWEAEPDHPGRWWLPGTRWRLKCNPTDCSVYQIGPKAGALELKKRFTTEIRAITALLDTIATRT